MIGKTLSHYRILDEISRGGMGIVYRALDLKLDREVALKVLPPELVADPERKRRFIQEAKAAARLEHPHIAVVYEIDETDGATFIVMELIRGEKLKDIISRDTLPLTRALELATEVAEGLARAHDKGIVHRDLKPSNIMVTEDGHAKVIDFGLAKLVEPLEAGGSDIETLTRGETDPGKVMGTISYMSPEQARGRTIDHRSDIFSLGTVLHEMITGQTPFKGESGVETLNAILKNPTPRLSNLGSDVPDEAAFEMQHLLDKCLAKDPADRYQIIKDVVVDLRALRRRLESGPVAPVVSPIRRPWLIAGAGAAAALLLVAVLLLLFRPSTPEKIAPAELSKPSIAVLYFENTTGDPDLDWLRTGLTDMLVTDLSQSQNLTVLSTDRLYQILRDMNRLDERITSLEVVQDVAQQANTGTVILGSFMKAGDHVRINIRVQDARSGEILSTEKVEGIGDSSIFSMVDELTRRIKSNFELTTAADTELDRNVTDVTTSSVEAYRYWVQSVNLHLHGNMNEAIALREKALELDPGFARALAGLSTDHSGLGHMKEAEEYARRALEQADRLPAHERYYIEGWYYSLREGTWERAIQAYQKALELDPNSLEPRHNMARRIRLFERFDEAIEHYEELRRRGYPFADTYSQLAFIYIHKGQFEKAYQALQEYLTRYPDTSRGHAWLGFCLTAGGKLDEALESFERAESLDPSSRMARAQRWRVFVLRQQWEKADRDANWLAASRDHSSQFTGSRFLAMARLYHGQSRDGILLLEQARSAYEEPEQNTAKACIDVAHVLLEKDQAAPALEQAERAQREGKGDWPEWWGLFIASLAQAKLGRWEEAERTAEALRTKAWSLPTEKEKRRYHHLMGELALARGDTRSAIRELEHAQSMLPARVFYGGGPLYIPIWNSLAFAYLSAGDEDKAGEWFRRIAESTTERIDWPIPYVRSFYFLGKIHENRGEMEKAREYYRRFHDYWKDGDMDRERVEEAKSKLQI